MATLRNPVVFCRKTSCAGNGRTLGKYDNDAAERDRARPKGLSARAVIYLFRGSHT